MKSIAAPCLLFAVVAGFAPPSASAAPDAERGSAYGMVVAKGLNWVEVSENGAPAARYFAPTPKTPADDLLLHAVRRAPVGGAVVLAWRRDGVTRRAERIETILPAPDPPPSRLAGPRGPVRFWFPAIPHPEPQPVYRFWPYVPVSRTYSCPSLPQRFGQPYQGQFGRVIGRVMEKGDDWIAVAGMDIVFSESTRFRAPDVLVNGQAAADPSILEAIRQIEPGRQVVLWWVHDGGLRVVRLSEFRNCDFYSPAELNHSWPGPKQ